jgi:hypothetical protein
VVALGLGAGGGLSASPVGAALAPPPPKTVDTWAWCGVNPDDPVAAAAVYALANAGGIDATFGPCNIPTEPYSAAFTSNRYVPPDVYMRLVQLNATVGMKTIVYDARFWSTPQDRNAAIAFWTPVLGSIAAWDMGDEFDPVKNPAEWNILKLRWTIMRTVVEPATGVKPFVNFLPTTLDQALTDLPGSERLLSFVEYNGDLGASLARAFDSRATLMCAVNEIDHQGLAPTPLPIRNGMTALIQAGCDQILAFTGFPVYDTSGFFGTSSVVEPNGAATNRATATQEGSGHSSLVPVGPLRVLETRTGPGLSTADGDFNGIGIRPDDSVLELGLSGRPQIPGWARSVVLNVTVTGALGAGYLTIYPCDKPRPTSSNINYDVGTTRAVAVVASIGSNGAVCVYTQTSTHVIVDLTAFYGVGASFNGIQPARLLETRSGVEFPTVDGQLAGIGRRPGNTTTEVKVAGRGGVPIDAKAVAVNVTMINPAQTGFATVYPCGEPLPLASTVNFTAGAIVPNAAMVKVGAGGAICVLSNVDTDVILDVNGYDAAQAVAQIFEPTRVLETRPGLTTFDHQFETQVPRPSDSVFELQIGGRIGIPKAIRAAALNITVTEATGPGFITIYPCGAVRPIASTLNYGKGTTVANLAVATTTTDGKVCIYTQTSADIVVDLSGYHT